MKNSLLIIVGAFLIAILAQLQLNPRINGYEIPITGQTLGVILVAYVLPKRLGLYSTVLYVLIGGLGLPVFAGFSGGFDVILGKTGGYIIGFIVAASVISMCFEERETHTLRKRLLIHVLATVIILVFGFLRLSMFIGWWPALEFGILPFLLGGLVKIIVGAWLSFWIDRKGWISRNAIS